MAGNGAVEDVAIDQHATAFVVLVEDLGAASFGVADIPDGERHSDEGSEQE